MDIPKRKQIRLQNFAYDGGGYFLTVCTKDRQPILAEFTPSLRLTPCGELVKKTILRLPEKYPYVTISKYVVMPDHFHLLMIINESPLPGPAHPGLSSIMGWLKYQCTREINALSGKTEGTVFQRSFHDHVIRSEEDFRQIWQYIDENPRNPRTQ